MSEHDWLSRSFEATRPRLRAVAYRMLGSRAEADDALQEAWLRLNRFSAAEVENAGGWLTTLVARVCLDMLRSRKSRREERLSTPGPQQSPTDAEGELALADSLGPALLVVLERLAPNERVAFVLHDMFDLSFEEIAAIVGRSPEAARQLASRARRRVRGEDSPEPDRARHRELVAAFLAASRAGDFEALLTVLAPDVVLRADPEAIRAAAANNWGGSPELAPVVQGAKAVAKMLEGRTRGLSSAAIDGEPGLVWWVGGQARSAFVFTLSGDRLSRIELIMAPERLSQLEIN